MLIVQFSLNMPTNNAPSAPNYSNSPVVAPKVGVSAAASSAALQNSRNATRGFGANDQQAKIDQIARQNDEAIANVPFAIGKALRSAFDSVASFFVEPKVEPKKEQRDRRAGVGTRATTKALTPTSVSTQAASSSPITQESTEASTTTTTTSQALVDSSTEEAAKSSTTTTVTETLFGKANTSLSEAQAALSKIESYPAGTLSPQDVVFAKEKFTAQQAYLNSFVDNNNALNAESEGYKKFEDDISFIKILDIKAAATIDLNQAKKEQEIVTVLNNRQYIKNTTTFIEVGSNYAAMEADYGHIKYNVDLATKALASISKAANNIEEMTRNSVEIMKNQCAATFSEVEASMMIINDMRATYSNVFSNYKDLAATWENYGAANRTIANTNYVEAGSVVLNRDLEVFEGVEVAKVFDSATSALSGFTAKCQADFKAATVEVAKAKALIDHYGLSTNIAGVLTEYQELKGVSELVNRGGDGYANNAAQYDDLRKFDKIARNIKLANVAQGPTLALNEDFANMNATLTRINKSQFVDLDLETELKEANDSFAKLEKIQSDIVNGAFYSSADFDKSNGLMLQDLKTFNEAATNIRTAGVKSVCYEALKIAQERIAELQEPQYENFAAASDLDSMGALYNKSSKAYDDVIKVANAANIDNEGNLSKIEEFLNDIYKIDIFYIKTWSAKALNDAYQYLQTALTDTSLTEVERRSLNDTYNLANEFYVDNISDLDLEGYKSGAMEEKWSEFKANVSRVDPATATAVTIENNSSASSGGGNKAGIIGGAVAGAFVVAALAVGVCCLRSKRNQHPAQPPAQPPAQHPAQPPAQPPTVVANHSRMVRLQNFQGNTSAL